MAGVVAVWKPRLPRQAAPFINTGMQPNLTEPHLPLLKEKYTTCQISACDATSFWLMQVKLCDCCVGQRVSWEKNASHFKAEFCVTRQHSRKDDTLYLNLYCSICMNWSMWIYQTRLSTLIWPVLISDRCKRCHSFTLKFGDFFVRWGCSGSNLSSIYWPVF